MAFSMETLKGNLGEEFHFLVEKHDFPISKTEEEIEEWIRALWQKKEERLKKFYTCGHFESKDNGAKMNGKLLRSVGAAQWTNFSLMALLIVAAAYKMWTSPAALLYNILAIAVMGAMHCRRTQYEIYIGGWP